MKLTHDIAIDAVQLVFGIMERADRDGPAGQINLGPKVVAEMREIAYAIKELNDYKG